MNSLNIRGDKKDEHEGKDNGRHWSERTYGSFARTIALPSYVEADKVKAEYKDGVLIVTLPKTEQAKPKQIKIDAH